MLSNYKWSGLGLFLLFALLSFNPENAFSQQRIYVDVDAGGLNDGTSWTDAYNDLQDALAAATNTDSIWVAEGTYYPSSTMDSTEFFDIKEEINVFGGFNGTEDMLILRNWINNPTILSGDIDMDGTTDNNSFTIVQMSLDSTYAKLDGFTLTKGYADKGSSSDIRQKTGGAIYIDGGATDGGIPVILNCTFTENYAAVNGGAIYCNGTSGGYAHAGIGNCIFENNRSIFKGGAISNDGESSPAIIGCTFSRNRSSEGAAVYNNGTDAESSPQVINCVFSDNRADNIGGAMFNFGNGATGISCPLILNCLIYNDTAISAAGIYSISDGGLVKPEIINCTFYDNYATSNGGHVYVNESNGGLTDVKIRNSILWGSSSNFAPHFGFSGNEDPKININYAIVDADSCAELKMTATGTLTCGTSMLYNMDPDFEDAANFNFRPKQNSPAIGYGDDSEIPADAFDLDKDGDTAEQVPVDLDLAPRFDGVVDLGPYEKPGGVPAALPVELLSFKARLDAGKVALSWVTLAEDNNDYFTIERSSNGIDFKAILWEEGAGTTDLARYYSVYDENPFSGINYYRLKQTDLDGRYKYSEVRTVDIKQKGQVTTFPNPVTTTLHVALSQFKVRQVDYEIYHLSGKMMLNGQADVNEGIVVISLDEVENLLPGTYIIRLINTEQGDLFGKFVKIGL